MRIKLSSIAVVVRSKNAGPFKITLDIILPAESCLEDVYRQLSKETVARLYKVDVNEVLSVVKYPPANAIKINLLRRVPAGSPGDTDVYGAQQHAPLLDLTVDLSKECVEALNARGGSA
jgi:hypothetical protein